MSQEISLRNLMNTSFFLKQMQHCIFHELNVQEQRGLSSFSIWLMLWNLLLLKTGQEDPRLFQGKSVAQWQIFFNGKKFYVYFLVYQYRALKDFPLKTRIITTRSRKKCNFMFPNRGWIKKQRSKKFRLFSHWGGAVQS